MIKIIMHGCNGHMGQMISGLVKEDPEAEIGLISVIIDRMIIRSLQISAHVM